MAYPCPEELSSQCALNQESAMLCSTFPQSTVNSRPAFKDQPSLPPLSPLKTTVLPNEDVLKDLEHRDCHNHNSPYYLALSPPKCQNHPTGRLPYHYHDAYDQILIGSGNRDNTYVILLGNYDEQSCKRLRLDIERAMADEADTWLGLDLRSEASRPHVLKLRNLLVAAVGRERPDLGSSWIMADDQIYIEKAMSLFISDTHREWVLRQRASMLADHSLPASCNSLSFGGMLDPTGLQYNPALGEVQCLALDNFDEAAIKGLPGFGADGFRGPMEVLTHDYGMGDTRAFLPVHLPATTTSNAATTSTFQQVHFASQSLSQAVASPTMHPSRTPHVLPFSSFQPASSHTPVQHFSDATILQPNDTLQTPQSAALADIQPTPMPQFQSMPALSPLPSQEPHTLESASPWLRLSTPRMSSPVYSNIATPSPAPFEAEASLLRAEIPAHLQAQLERAKRQVRHLARDNAMLGMALAQTAGIRRGSKAALTELVIKNGMNKATADRLLANQAFLRGWFGDKH